MACKTERVFNDTNSSYQGLSQLSTVIAWTKLTATITNKSTIDSPTMKFLNSKLTHKQFLTEALSYKP